uniref:ABC transporter ATP-binding protein n=1 Tax=Alloprevotella sp. TaxID=1872471 RepID=UPI00402614A6
MTRPLPHIIRYLITQLRGHSLQITLNTTVGILLVLLDLTFVWATKLAIDVATHNTTAVTLHQAFLLIALIMFTRIVLGLSSRWIRAILGVKAQNSMRQHLFNRLLRCKWTELKTYHTGNLTNRIEHDVNDVVNFVTESIPSFITTLAQFIGAFFFLFFMDSTLAIIIVCVIPFFIISSKLYIKKMRKLSHQARDEESKIQSTIQESLQHVMIIKTLQRVAYFTNRLTSQQAQLHQIILSRTRYATISSSLLNLGFATGYFVTFVWGATNLSKGLITYGAMLAFIQLVGQIQGPVRNLSKFIPIFITSFTATERLMDIENIAQEEANTPTKLLPSVGVQLSNLTFQYTTSSRLIFNNFSYSFPAGSITAIVGETGAGKTTLIRLLLSLIQPTEGKITLIDGSGKEFTMRPDLRANFAYVPQGNTLFSGTIRSNLLLGKPDATDEELKTALHTAAADFVYKKAKGLETPCGEAGDGLSEGQAQRIAIARALLADGNVFIFDEATSSLDPTTEETVLQRIVTHFANRTLIFITHRPLVLKYVTQKLKL